MLPPGKSSSAGGTNFHRTWITWNLTNDHDLHITVDSTSVGLGLGSTQPKVPSRGEWGTSLHCPGMRNIPESASSNASQIVYCSDYKAPVA
eukprot:s2182_g4.t1